MARLRREEAALGTQGCARSASAAVKLLLRACLIGLHVRLPQLLETLSAHLDEDAAFASVVDCGHRLVTLWRAREPLGVQQHPQLRVLLQRVWPAALFLLPNLEQCDEAGEMQAVKQLLALREFGRLLARIADGGEPDPEDEMGIDMAPLHAQLDRFVTSPSAAPAICGAAAALLFLDGVCNESTLEAVLHQRFGAGAQPREAVQFLWGVMTALPNSYCACRACSRVWTC